MSRTFCFILSLLFVLNAYSSNLVSKERPIAQKGQIDISDWDFERKGPVSLNGDWSLYWNKFIRADDINEDLTIKTNQSSFFYVPGAWNGKPNPDNIEEELTSFGYATFALKIIVPENFDDLSLKFKDMASSYALYIFDQDRKKLIHIISNGSPGETKEKEQPQYLPKVSDQLSYLINTDKKELLLILHISNHFSHLGGPWNNIDIGNKAKLESSLLKDRLTSFGLIGLSLIMGLYHLALYFQRKKDKASLFFSLACFSITLRGFTVDKFYFYFTKTANPFFFELHNKFEYFSFYLTVYFFFLFVYHLTPREYYLKLAKIHSALTTFYIIVTIIFNLKFFSGFIQTIYLLAILLPSLFIMIAHLIKESLKSNLAARNSALGFLPLLLACVNDALNALEVIESIYITPYGFAIFILAQSYTLSKIFTDAAKTAEYLSENLKLEVDKQTVALRSANQEMTKQKLIIEKQYDKIKNDVLLAADVMLEMLPSDSFKNDVCDFKTFFKPADELAGDLYGMEVQNNKLMFWICDVTGHGVASSMVAGVVREAMAMCRLELLLSTKSPDPAAALKFVCETVRKSIKGKFFATMILGVFDFETKVLTTSSAAHLKPIHLTKGEFQKKSFSKMPSGPLIGFMGDSEIIYENYTSNLTDGDLLFFYTDGVAEAAYDDDSPQFGKRRILKYLMKEHENEDLLQGLLNAAIKFQKKEYVDDDVTMMVLKVSDLSSTSNENTQIDELLVVDDDANVLFSLQNLFETNFPEWKITYCSSASEARHKLKENTFKCILSDARMPKESGVSLLKFIKEDYPYMRKILLTGYAEKEDLKEATNIAKVDMILYKPWKDDELCSQLSALIKE